MNYGQTRPKDIDWNGETKFYRQPMKSEFLYQQSQFTPPVWQVLVKYSSLLKLR